MTAAMLLGFAAGVAVTGVTVIVTACWTVWRSNGDS
jgi:hypothetical protein